METHCLRHSEIPGTSRLFQDYVYHFDRLSRFYPHAPYNPASYQAAACESWYPESRRAALVRALRTTNGDSAALARLAQPGTSAVVTGQQVGLFSGPAYTIYKALTAFRLAQDLTKRGMPTVPVFWLATEDHDFIEVNHARVFTDQKRPVTLRAEGERVPNQPVGSIPLISPPVAELTKALAGFPFGEEVAALVREAYVPGATLGEAFHGLLSRILEKFGFVFVDPLVPAIRQIAAPFLDRARALVPGLNRQLRERSSELVEAGYHAQVLVEEDTSLLFRIDGKHRSALRLKNGAFGPAEMAVPPEQLSPNALLRPVLQDYLLPTVTYVGGAAELAYLGQSEVIYRELLGRMPVILPRSGFTIIDQRSYRAMEKFAMPLPAFFAPADAVRERMAARLVPPTLQSKYAETRKDQGRMLDSLRRETLSFDPTLAKAADKIKAKIEYQLAKLESKVAREALRRDQFASAEAESLCAQLYPEKHLQERYYSILPFVAEHGMGLLDALSENVHFDCSDHKILIV
jgi:bacillithiol biosynthesis cysteine-adding enzyme BshC